MICIMPRLGAREKTMAKIRRTYKLKWRAKKANHGVKPNCGRDKSRIKRSMNK